MSYSDWDNEPEYEPMPEFLEKIQELLTEQVRLDRVEMVKEMHDLRKRNNDLVNRNLEIQRKLSDVEIETGRKIEAARKEFEREMFGGFLRGDTFYRPMFEIQKTPCEKCGGKGFISATLENQETVQVKCFGEGCENGSIKEGLFIIKEFKIKRLSLYQEDWGKHRVWVYYSNGYSESDVDSKECFKTAEAAQVEADKKTREYREEQARKKGTK